MTFHWPKIIRQCCSAYADLFVLAIITLGLFGDILLLANSGARGGESGTFCNPMLSLASVGCFLRNYKEISSSLLGVIGILTGAWIAWEAVKNQLTHDEKLATAGQSETLETILVSLKEDFLGPIEKIWKSIDLASPSKSTQH